jgi:hypothetical protein
MLFNTDVRIKRNKKLFLFLALSINHTIDFSWIQFYQTQIKTLSFKKIKAGMQHLKT